MKKKCKPLNIQRLPKDKAPSLTASNEPILVEMYWDGEQTVVVTK